MPADPRREKRPAGSVSQTIMIAKITRVSAAVGGRPSDSAGQSAHEGREADHE